MRFSRTRTVLIVVLALAGIVQFGYDFFLYATQDYVRFIRHGVTFDDWRSRDLWETFAASGARFTCRIGYVTGCVGLLFRRRWGAFLVVAVWLFQLVPDAFYQLSQLHQFDAGLALSAGTLAVFLVLVALGWPVLLKRRAVIYALLGLLAGFVVHAVAFAGIYASAHVPAPTPDEGKQTEFRKAVFAGDADKVKAMLADHSFHPQVRGTYCDSNTICNLASEAAMDQSSAEVMRALHDAGVPMDEPDGGTGDTPLIRALIAGHIEIAEYLADHIADPMQPNRFGISAFIGACNDASPKLLESMIASGAKVNTRQTLPDLLSSRQSTDMPPVHGVTPLMIAAANGKLDLLQVLVRHGADATLTDSQGRNVYTYIKFGKDPSIEPAFTDLVKAGGK